MDRIIKKKPYGISDFSNMREFNGYYVDNTWGILLLEKLPYQLFLRPRRFGKSLLLSILDYYYNVNSADHFDDLFGGTLIHEHPTPLRIKYLVLHLDFSKVSGNTLEEYQESFESVCEIALDMFLFEYSSFIPQAIQERVAQKKTFAEALDVLTTGLGIATNLKIFILVDEYDNFSNRLLAQEGDEAYRKLCHNVNPRTTEMARSLVSWLKLELGILSLTWPRWVKWAICVSCSHTWGRHHFHPGLCRRAGSVRHCLGEYIPGWQH